MRWIEDYSVIGDCRSAALVSRDGSVDWLCWPRFDSPSLFGALLDERAGCWKIAPAGPFRAERRYLENTNVLQTRFHTDAGSLIVTDLMPVASEGQKRRMLQPEHEILRVVECRGARSKWRCSSIRGPAMAWRRFASSTPASWACAWRRVRASCS